MPVRIPLKESHQFDRRFSVITRAQFFRHSRYEPDKFPVLSVYLAYSNRHVRRPFDFHTHPGKTIRLRNSSRQLAAEMNCEENPPKL
jgi:hypothetical protein